MTGNPAVVLPHDSVLWFKPLPFLIQIPPRLLSGTLVSSTYSGSTHTSCVTCLVLNILLAIFCLYPRLLNIFPSPWLLKMLHQNSICREQKTHMEDICIPAGKPKEYATRLHHKTDTDWCVSVFCCEVALKCCIWCFSEMWQNMKHLVCDTPASLGAEERQTPFSLCRHHGEPEHSRMTSQADPVEWQTCKIPYPPHLHDFLLANVSLY